MRRKTSEASGEAVRRGVEVAELFELAFRTARALSDEEFAARKNKAKAEAIVSRMPSYAARCVAFVITDFVNKAKGYAWPATDKISELLHMDRSTVMAAIAECEKVGLFVVDRRAGTSSRYIPTFLTSAATSRKIRPVEPATSRKIRPDQSEIPTAPVGNSDPIPIKSPLDPSMAPAAAGDLTAAAAGAKPLQRELPLLRKFSRSGRAPRREVEKADERLCAGLIAALGEGYGNLVAWAPPELDARAIAAEIARPGAGVALMLNAWRAASELRQAQGAA